MEQVLGEGPERIHFVQYDDTKVKWSRNLKRDFQRGRKIEYSSQSIRTASPRPFKKMCLYFADLAVDERGANHLFYPSLESENENRNICLTDLGSEKPFMSLMTNHLTDLHFVGAGAGTQSFPFYTYDEDGSNRRENITDWALQQFQGRYGEAVTKWDIFYYVYGLLHSSDYRTKYAQNLKRDLPHIPFVSADDFAAFTAAGQRLATLHVDYDKAPEYPLRHSENRAVTWTWRVQKMRLSPDKTQLTYNEALTLVDIPPAVYEYRLGNRSALEWVIDQYQVKTDKRSGIVSDPNNPEDPEAIVRLIKQVVTVSLETVKVVHSLPRLEAVAVRSSEA